MKTAVLLSRIFCFSSFLTIQSQHLQGQRGIDQAHSKYDRKDMIGCRIPLYLDEKLEFSQLFDHIQVTVKNDSDELNSEIPALL